MQTDRKLRERVATELKTTFASHDRRTVSLADPLSPEAMRPMRSVRLAPMCWSIRAAVDAAVA
jgi:hypothetical protein